MPIGIISNGIAIIVGSFLGASCGRFIPERVRAHLPSVFGLTSMAMGIFLVVKLHSLPCIVLAVILGTIVGELIDIEHHAQTGTAKLKKRIENISGKDSAEDDQYIQKYVSLIFIFCAGATGILGAMSEAITGDHTVLFTKTILDLFTSAIFAASMGYLIMFIGVLQFAFFIILYFISGFIIPYASPEMIQDFMAAGGILTIAVGFRLCEIKQIRIMNMIPSLIFSMPISLLWMKIIG